MMKRIRATLASGVALWLCAAGAQAQTQAPANMDFSGRSIAVIIGFAPGGSYDFYGRLLARHLGRHLPGAPSVVAQNMPGAGSLTAANHLFNAAPKDGTSIGIVSQTMAIEAARGAPGVAYRVAEFSWIGRMAPIVEITMARRGSAIRRIEDAIIHEAPIASTGPGSPSEAYPKLMNEIIGTKFKIIGGYRGASDAMLALERQEVDVVGTAWNTLRVTKPDWITGQKVDILVQYALTRSPEMKDVPTLVEFGRSDADRDLLGFYVSSADVGRSFFAPPGLAPERVRVLRRGFDKAMADPALLSEIEKSKADFGPMTGEDLQEMMAKVAGVSPVVVERLRRILEEP